MKFQWKLVDLFPLIQMRPLLFLDHFITRKTALNANLDAMDIDYDDTGSVSDIPLEKQETDEGPADSLLIL